MNTHRPGDTIDNRYLLEAHIGSGGFADVFKAKDEMTGATIAIKIYNSMDTSGVAIFQKEYLKMSDVHHSRLLTANHFGVHESSPYLIMPFCKHGNLTRLLIDEDHYLSEEKLATILLQVSEGLEYLHKHGIVHQDIKPDNILEKKEEEYVLSDFGISQRARSTLLKSVRRTEKMGSKGTGYTPAYAPPARERLSNRPTPSKDIFSLGATFYELSAKELPYNDMGEAVERKLEIPDLEHGYSPGWNQLLQSCLALEPEARPTATELKQMAQQYLAQGVWTFPKREKASSPQAQSPPSRKQKSATPATPAEEAKSTGSKTAKSKRGWLLALLAIPVVAGLGWGVFQMFGPGRALPEAKWKGRAAASYRTIRLNGQTWLAQNLNYDIGSGSWCYDNDPANCRKYGRLYTWAAAKKACAALGSGWRLPTDREWQRLANAYGGYSDYRNSKDVGDPKRSYKALLDSGSSGFNALLGGNRINSLGTLGYYWSGTEEDAQRAWGYLFSSYFRKLSRFGYDKAWGYSCRCLKDN